jgi:cyclopropane fatty-acyl-phospholipid synthase-like methyltransferase
MIQAFLNDLFQRVLTVNKWEQRNNLSGYLKALNLKPGSRCLDFGCGTALFAPVFTASNLNYYGYDIDQHLLDYASRIYKNIQLTSSLKDLEATAPFDLILANCCFHHIDSWTLDAELHSISTLLADGGTFIMIDILLPQNDSFWLRKLFRKLERGVFIRTESDYSVQVKRHFTIIQRNIERSHLLSLKKNPVYNDLLVLICRKYHARKESYKRTGLYQGQNRPFLKN